MRRSLNACALAGALTATALLAGCGDNGGEPPTEPPPGHAKDNYFAYQSFPLGSDTHEPGGLTLVQAEDPSQRIVLADDGVSDVTVLYLGDPGEGTVENSRGHTLMYVQGGYWMKVSLRQNGSQVPVRASSTPVTDACLSVLLPRTPTSSAGAFLLYFEAGADTACFTDDDVMRRIPVSGSPGSPALSVPAGSIAGSFYSPDRELEGFLLFHDGVLRLYNETFGNPKVVLEGVSSVQGAMQLPEGNYLAIDGSMRLVTPDGEVSAPLDSNPFVLGFADGDYIYFTDSDDSGQWQLFRLPRGGTGPSEMMWDGESNGYVSAYGATEDAILVYAADYGANRRRLYAVPRDAAGATSAPLLEDVDGELSFNSIYEAPLLYTVLDRASGATVVTAKTLRYDGTLESAGPGTEWVGRQAAASQPRDFGSPVFRAQSLYTHGYFVEGVADRDATQHQKAVLKARRLDDGVDTTLTTVTENARVLLYGTGAAAIGMLANVVTDGQHDVIAVDLDVGSFARITDTEDRAEYVSAF